jgi:hypothetical protein
LVENVPKQDKPVSKPRIATRDLPLDETQHLASLMLQLHADFRRRHALPPLPTAWTLLDDMKALRSRASLADPGVLESRALGGALTFVRRMIWTVLKPLFFRQTEVNRDVIFALEALAREREQARHAHFVLAERIAELEAELARPRE